MTPFDFLKLTLAVWYIAYAVTSTAGPGSIFHWMREKLPHGRHGFRTVVVQTTSEPYFRPGQPTEEKTLQTSERLQNGLLDCIICASPWVALIVGIVGLAFDRMWVIDVFAIAGGALLLHSYTGWRYGE